MAEVSRRTVLATSAWGIPVLALAVAAPTASASDLRQLGLGWTINPLYPRFSDDPDDDSVTWETLSTLTITNYGNSTTNVPITVTITLPARHDVSYVTGQFDLVGQGQSLAVLQSNLPLSPGGALSVMVMVEIYTEGLVPDTSFQALLQAAGYPTQTRTLKVDYPDHYT